jgi:hypothetical protein
MHVCGQHRCSSIRVDVKSPMLLLLLDSRDWLLTKGIRRASDELVHSLNVSRAALPLNPWRCSETACVDAGSWTAAARLDASPLSHSA